MSADLPEGFTVDPGVLPEGFAVDEDKPAVPEKSFMERTGENARRIVTDLPKTLHGIGEAAAGALTGAVAAPVADSIGAGVAIGQGDAAGHETIGNIKDKMTYAPRTQEGKQASEALATIATPITYVAKKAGELIKGLTGSDVAKDITQDVAPAAIAPVLKGAGALTPKFAPKITATPAEMAVAQAGQKAGYKISPKDIPNAGMLQRNAGALGKEKTEQLMRIKNQPISNDLAKDEVGIAKDREIDASTLKGALAKAGAPYQAIEQLPLRFKGTTQFRTEVADASKEFIEFGKKYPNIQKTTDIQGVVKDLSAKEFTPKEAIFLIKKLRKEGNSNIASAHREGGNPGKIELSKVQLKAAEAVEDMMERALAQTGQAKLVQQLRAGRQQYAKVMDLAKATDASGNVNPAYFSKRIANGDPVTGNFKLIGDMHAHFPKSTANASNLGGSEGLTVFDAWFAGGQALAGHPIGAAAALSRPWVRNRLAGTRMQKINAPKPITLAKKTPIGGSKAVPYTLGQARDSDQ